VLDGINSEGLVVAIAAEEESGGKVGREPGDEVGMHERKIVYFRVLSYPKQELCHRWGRASMCD
jgi:hypothetical protein